MNRKRKLLTDNLQKRFPCTRTVSKKGIGADGGLYIAAELGRRVGQELHVRRDPADWGRIYVFEQDAKGVLHFVCLARDPVRLGIDRRQIAIDAKKLAREQDSADRKRARDLKRERRPEAAIDDVLERAAADAEKVVALPRPGEEHHTDGLDAAAEAAAAGGVSDRRAAAEEARISIFRKFYREV